MKQLKIQDFIFIGIYTAIYFFIVFICMLVLSFTIPVFSSILIPSVTALFSGLVYLLLIQRIPRFGAITLMGSIMGLFFLLSGHFPLSFVTNLIFSVLADGIQYKTKLPQKLRTGISYIVFCFGLMGPVLPLWFMKNAYVASLVARGKDEAYITKAFVPITTLSFFVCVGLTILFGIIGIYLGGKLYRKHFEKVKSGSYGKNIRNV